MRKTNHSARATCSSLPVTLPRALYPPLLAVLIAAGLLGSLTAAAAAPAEERLQRIRADIEALKVAVSRGDKTATRKTGSRIEQGLAELHQELLSLPPLRLSVGNETAALKYLGDRRQSTELAGEIITQEGITEDLAALRAQVLSQRRYRLSDGHEVSLRYYPPADLFVVQDLGQGNEAAALDFLALVDRPRRFASVVSRATDIEMAWSKADKLALTVQPAIARRLALDSNLLRMRYLHTGAVAPEGSAGRTYDDLLKEIQAQLEYIVNIKGEGPPLIAALRTGLFFDDQFGFEAWGGRWSEFAGTIFFLRYDSAREEFLVTVERLAPG